MAGKVHRLLRVLPCSSPPVTARYRRRVFFTGCTSAAPGSSTTYTIVVTNSGPSDVNGATVSDGLPASYTNASWTAVYSAGSSGPTSGSGPMAGVLVSLLSGGTATFTVTGTILATATGTLSNTASVTPPAGVTDPTPGNNSATDTTSLTPTGDLSITKTDSVDAILAGSPTSYTIVVSNAGPSFVTGARVVDTLPSNLTNATWTATFLGAGSTGSTSGSGDLNQAISLAPGGSAIYTVSATVSVSASGTIVNTATVSAPAGLTDPTPGNNSATDSTTVSRPRTLVPPYADLRVTKTDNQTTDTPGTSISYTIVVLNDGPDDVTGATVTDILPGTIADASWTAVYSTGSSGTTSGSGSISGVSVNILAGGSATFTVIGTILPSATGTLSNTATVTVPAGFTDTTPENNSATDITTLSPAGDLSITKTDNQATDVPGTSITYTIVVSNAGPSDVSGALVNDVIPATITNVSWTAVYSRSSSGVANGTGSLSNVAVNLLAGGTATFTVTGTVAQSARGTLTNTATVTAPAGFTDSNTSNDSATDTTTLVPTADLQITKTDNKTAAVPGTAATYTIVVTNAGPTDVTGATVTDGLPASLTGATWTAAYSAGSSGAASGSGSISGVAVSLLSGGTATFTITATIAPAATGTLSNTATVTAPAGFTDPTPGNNSATDNTTLTPQANLSLTKSNGASSTVPGSNTTYTITVTNSGPSTATGATVRDTLPTGTTFVSATNGATYDAANNRVNFTAGTLAPNGSTSFTVTLAVGAGLTGTLANSATVSPPPGVTDPDPTNDTGTDTDTLTPTGDLSITKTDGKTSAVPGTANTYTIVVTNAGPSTVTGAAVSDGLPAAFTNAAWTAVYSTGSTGTVSGSGSIAGVLVNLLSGGTATFTVTGTIDPAATGTLSNTATVTAPTPGNNSATDNTTLTPQANLSLTKTNGVTSVRSGSQVTYTFTVTNLGPNPVTGATVTDTLPEGMTFVSATGGGVYNSATRTVTFTTGSLAAANGTATFTSTVSITATGGTISNSATVSPPPGVTDPTPGNNTATDTDTVTANTILVATNDIGCDTTHQVFVLDPTTGSLRSSFAAYEFGFRGGLRATIADIDGDGADEIITAPGRGRVGELRVFEQDGTELVSYRTQPFGGSYVNGLDVAIGDVDGDGDQDIVAAMASGGSTVAVFRNNRGSADPIENVAFRSFRPFAANFLGGATVAVADMGSFSSGRAVRTLSLDGRAEIIVGSGSGMAPTVLVYDVSSTPAVIDRFAALTPKLRSGISVSTARFNGDAIPDIVVAAGRNGGSMIDVYDGTVSSAANTLLARQTALAAFGKANGAAFAAMADLNGNGIIDDGEIFATQGDGGADTGIKRLNRAGAVQSTLAGSPKGPLRIVASPRR